MLAGTLRSYRDVAAAVQRIKAEEEEVDDEIDRAYDLIEVLNRKLSDLRARREALCGTHEFGDLSKQLLPTPLLHRGFRLTHVKVFDETPATQLGLWPDVSRKRLVSLFTLEDSYGVIKQWSGHLTIADLMDISGG